MNDLQQIDTIPHPKAVLLKVGDAHYAIVDEKHYEWLSSFKWRAVRKQKSTYAVVSIKKGGRYRDTGMHRIIAKTLPGFVCHHKNRNSLDNREINLRNMTKKEHQLCHINNSLTVIYEQKTSNAPDTQPFLKKKEN